VYFSILNKVDVFGIYGCDWVMSAVILSNAYHNTHVVESRCRFDSLVVFPIEIAEKYFKIRIQI
jgi:hypothetical protein